MSTVTTLSLPLVKYKLLINMRFYHPISVDLILEFSLYFPSFLIIKVFIILAVITVGN